MKAIFNKAKDVVVSGLSFVGKVAQGAAAAIVGVVTYTTNADAVITIDTAAITADIAVIGAAVVGIVLATVAFKIAKSMLGGTR